MWLFVEKCAPTQHIHLRLYPGNLDSVMWWIFYLSRCTRVVHNTYTRMFIYNSIYPKAYIARLTTHKWKINSSTVVRAAYSTYICMYSTLGLCLEEGHIYIYICDGSVGVAVLWGGIFIVAVKAGNVYLWESFFGVCVCVCVMEWRLDSWRFGIYTYVYK